MITIALAVLGGAAIVAVSLAACCYMVCDAVLRVYMFRRRLQSDDISTLEDTCASNQRSLVELSDRIASLEARR